MDELETTVGIVIQAMPYRDYDKILTLFTPQGLLKIFVKGSYKTHLAQHSYTTLFVRGEYLYRNGPSLAKLQEGTLLSFHLSLRNSLAALESAFKLGQALLKSQASHKSAPKLFQLCSAYLEKLAEAPETLATSFLLKILKHEGLLQVRASCYVCEIITDSSWRLGGKSFCKAHAPQNALNFSIEEEKSLLFLTEARSLSEMCLFSFEKEFTDKITALFEEEFR